MPVDGNVERVTTRLFRIKTPLPAAKAEIGRAIHAVAPERRHGDFAQALMDLGATICTPRAPACPLCPWGTACAAAAVGDAEGFPVKAAKTARPTRRGRAYVAIRADGAVLLRRRPESGLLGGMAEVPGSDWAADLPALAPPVTGKWETVARPVVHVFTHFRLELTVALARLPQRTAAPAGHWWSTSNALPGEALPTVMKKVLRAAAVAV